MSTLPEEVPELKAPNIRRWGDNGGYFCCDLQEWSSIVFGAPVNPRLAEIAKSVFQRAGAPTAQRFRRADTEAPLLLGAASDAEAELLATAWNTYIEELGYTEPLQEKWSR